MFYGRLRNRNEDIQAHLINSLIGTNYCPVCSRFSSFEPFGKIERQKALCPNCKSVERHRFLFLLLEELLKDKNDVTVLYVGGDTVIENNLQFKIKCIKVPDSKKKELTLKYSDFEEDSFDIIICGDVFGHISNAELFVEMLGRTLRKNGIFISTYNKSNCSERIGDDDDLKIFHDVVCNQTIDSLDNILSKYFDTVFLRPDNIFSEEQIKLYSIGGSRYCIGKKLRL